MPTVQIGESYVGEGMEAAHVNTVLGERSGPVGVAWTTALGDADARPRAVPRRHPARARRCSRPTLFVNKATIAGERHAEMTWGAAQAAVAAGVADCVADDTIKARVARRAGADRRGVGEPERRRRQGRVREQPARDARGRCATVPAAGRSSRRCSTPATTRGTRSTGRADPPMDLRSTAELDAFRAEARDWLVAALDGEFRGVRGRGGPGDEHALFEERLAWERALGAAGWTCLQWPREYGGRDASLLEQVVFYEEYARAGGPGRVGLVGEGLIGPTILHFGTDEQRARFLPRIASGEEQWCQGYSEPNAGSDLANLVDPRRARRRRVGDRRAEGVDVARALGAVVLRARPHRPRRAASPGHLVPARADGPARHRDPTDRADHRHVGVQRGLLRRRPDRVPTSSSARSTAAGRSRWARSRSSGARSTLGQQLGFVHEWQEIAATARERGITDDPVDAAAARAGVDRARDHAVHRDARAHRAQPRRRHARDVDRQALLGAAAPGHGRARDGRARPVVRRSPRRCPYELTRAQAMFLYTRADTIYGGSNQIQRNIIGERVLGLPPEPKVV